MSDHIPAVVVTSKKCPRCKAHFPLTDFLARSGHTRQTCARCRNVTARNVAVFRHSHRACGACMRPETMLDPTTGRTRRLVRYSMVAGGRLPLPVPELCARCTRVLADVADDPLELGRILAFALEQQRRLTARIGPQDRLDFHGETEEEKA